MQTQVDITCMPDSDKADVSASGLDDKVLTIGGFAMTMGQDQMEAIHLAIQPYFYEPVQDIGDDQIIDNNIELCSALKAIRALAGENQQLLKIIDDVLEECEV